MLVHYMEKQEIKVEMKTYQKPLANNTLKKRKEKVKMYYLRRNIGGTIKRLTRDMYPIALPSGDIFQYLERKLTKKRSNMRYWKLFLASITSAIAMKVNQKAAAGTLHASQRTYLSYT